MTETNLEERLQVALDVCAKMQEQRDELVLERKRERADNFIAGFICAGGGTEEAKSQAIQFGCCVDFAEQASKVHQATLLAGKLLTAGADVTDGRVEIEIAGWGAATETILTAPERIWLQVGDQAHYHSEPFPRDTSEVSWCADSVVGCEVPYVRADLVGKVPAPDVPEGWQLEALDNDCIVVKKDGVGLYVASFNAENIASTILHAFASDMLAAAPKPEGGAA